MTEHQYRSASDPEPAALQFPGMVGISAEQRDSELQVLAGVACLLDVVSAASASIGTRQETPTLPKSIATVAALARETVEALRAQMAQ